MAGVSPAQSNHRSYTAAVYKARQLLSDLSQRDARSFSGSASDDLAEIVSYYTSHKSADAFIINRHS